MKFRKKPVEVEAVQLLRTRESMIECLKFMGVQANLPQPPRCFDKGIHVNTPEGRMLASFGDWIVKDANGEFYPCRPDVFKQTYENITE